MGIWDKPAERFFKQYGEKWYIKGECTLHPFLELLHKGQKNIKLVTGEADPDLYNREDVAGEFKNLLNNEVAIEIIFNKKESKEKAINGLLYDNKRLVSLKEKYDERLKIYWQKRRSPVHFAVVDSSHILLEKIHEAYKPREVLIKYKTEVLGQHCDKEFDKLKESESTEITLEELIKVREK